MTIADVLIVVGVFVLFMLVVAIVAQKDIDKSRDDQ